MNTSFDLCRHSRLWRWQLRFVYPVRVIGVGNLPKNGVGHVIVVNHLSRIDACVVAGILPAGYFFAPHDLSDVIAVRDVTDKLQKGQSAVFFPEGCPSDTNALMKLYEGAALILEKTSAPLLTIHINGTQHTLFSDLKSKVKRLIRPSIEVTIGAAERMETGLSRTIINDRILDLMEKAQFLARHKPDTLWHALNKAAKQHGYFRIVSIDIMRKPLRYLELIIKARILGHLLSSMTGARENVGLLLPTANITLVAFFGLQAYGRVPAMLNPGAGADNVNAAIAMANVKCIVTSHRFVKAAGIGDLVEKLNARIVYLEDAFGGMKPKDKLKALFARLPDQPLPHDSGVVLFTSGSENAPKAVVLSHDNVLANIAQITARVDFNQSDIAFNALPLFHTFGLTAGALLPVVSGIKAILYPNPLHYREIPEWIYQSGATMMFASDTLLSGYARHAHPYDLKSLKRVFAGAEKLREETRRLYADRFGVRVFQGYGVTETSPVAAVNTALQSKTGTVGRLMPGMEARLEAVDGLAEGQRLFLRGPNVMLGYYKADAPGVIISPQDGWHDTGDIVNIDDEGYIAIQGRAKRFAKIAGEMVSLVAVETLASGLWPDHQHAAVAKADEKKGEQIVLFTTAPAPDRAALVAWAKSQNAADLIVPKMLIEIAEMPLLPTGKIDHKVLSARVAV